MNLPIFLLQKICCLRLIMEQVTGFEPVSSAWQAEILTIILYLHGISDARAGPALSSSVTTPESGGDIQNRTEDERLQSSRFTIKLYRHISFPRIRTSQRLFITL